MNCQKIANQHNRCKALCLQFPHCTCEQHSVSPYSPGIVQDEECLVRLIFSPTHFNEQTGKLKPFAFFDCKDKGLSVNRMQYTSVEELKQTAAFISHGRKIIGGVVAKCADIRAVLDEHERDYLSTRAAKYEINQALSKSQTRIEESLITVTTPIEGPWFLALEHQESVNSLSGTYKWAETDTKSQIRQITKDLTGVFPATFEPYYYR